MPWQVEMVVFLMTPNMKMPKMQSKKSLLQSTHGNFLLVNIHLDKTGFKEFQVFSIACFVLLNQAELLL